MLERGEAEVEAVLEATDFLRMERPPKLGPWDTEAGSLWPPTSSGELLEVLLEAART